MRLLIIFVFIAISWTQNTLAESSDRKFFVGTSAFMLANLDQSTDEPPHFYQFNFGYRLTEKDVISLEAITWRYYGPLGSQIYSSSVDENGQFPGHVSASGVGLAYQRFIWRGLYSALHGQVMKQKYVSDNGSSLGSGHQLFLTFRVGYHIAIGSSGFFIEPSAAMTHWPINTGLPQSFQAKEDLWPKHQFEPGLHIGYRF